MGTKQEYYHLILENRRIVSDPENLKCPCPDACEWHGRCRECVALHRYHKDHVPVCMQEFINERLADLVGIGELKVVHKEGTPLRYRMYVKERDKELTR